MTQKKKILILSCQGGGGHMSAAHAIASYLAAHAVKIVDFIGDSLAHLDPIYYVTSKKYTGQDIYNFLLHRNQKRLINGLFYIGISLIRLRKKKLKKSITAFFLQEKPDIIISVIPLINDVITQVAQELGIRCFVVPTDCDAHTFINNINIQHTAATICLPFEFPEILQPIGQSTVLDSTTIRVTGFPVRPSFMVSKDNASIRKKFAVPDNKPIILLVMGATGSTATLDYLDALNTVSLPIHIMICIGRSTQLQKPIEKRSLKPHISITIIDHTQNIADVMAIADIGISKPGSVTFAEMLYMNLPLLLDNTTPALLWEQLNIDLVQKYYLGNIIQHYDHIAPLVTHYLTDQTDRARVKRNIQALDKKNFADTFIQLVNTSL